MRVRAMLASIPEACSDSVVAAHVASIYKYNRPAKEIRNHALFLPDTSPKPVCIY